MKDDEFELTDPAAIVEVSEPVDKVLVARLLAGSVILALFVALAVQNSDTVDFTFLAWSFEIRQFFLMVVSAVVGALIWSLAGAYSRRVARKATK